MGTNCFGEVINQIMSQNRTAIITGASSGIGQAAAIRLASEGYLVVLAARRLDRLQAAADRIREAGGEALVIQTDISDPDQIQNLVDQTIEKAGRIDLLVNNAGYGRLLWLDEQKLVGEIDQQIQVNLTGAIQLTRAALPVMLEQKSGQILFVSSISGFVGVPTYSIYTATKYGLRGFIESLRREVSGSGVTVTGIYPGAVETEFDQHAGVQWETTRVTPDWLIMTPEQVAGEILRAVKKRRRRIITPAVMILPILVNAHFPRLLDWVLSGMFFRKDGKTTAWNQAEDLD
jgi:short-subunit dehydrogenase